MREKCVQEGSQGEGRQANSPIEGMAVPPRRSDRPLTLWIINQYASSPSTGYAGRHYYLARELAAQGHQVYVVAASFTHLLRESPRVDGDVTIETIDGVHMVWLRMPSYPHAHSKKRVWNWLRFAWALRRLPSALPESPGAILYSSPTLVGFLGAQRLARRFDVPLIFEVRDIWPLTLMQVGGYSERHPVMRFLQWIEDKAYRESDRVISNLKNAVEHMQARGMDPAKFAWVPNGFSMAEVSKPEPLDPSTRAQLPRDKFIVGYTGTLGVANALDTLLDAAERLKNEDDVAFVLVGGGKEKPALQRRAKEKGLKNVVFIDPIPKAQIQTMLQCFDVCFIGLSKEPLFHFGVSPNKLFDYLISGRPIIYSIDSGAYRPVDEAGCGLTVPAEDSGAIAEAVMKLKMLSEAERGEMGGRGRAYALGKHEYGELAGQLLHVVDGAIDEKGV